MLINQTILGVHEYTQDGQTFCVATAYRWAGDNYILESSFWRAVKPKADKNKVLDHTKLIAHQLGIPWVPYCLLGLPKLTPVDYGKERWNDVTDPSGTYTKGQGVRILTTWEKGTIQSLQAHERGLLAQVILLGGRTKLVPTLDLLINT